MLQTPRVSSSSTVSAMLISGVQGATGGKWKLILEATLALAAEATATASVAPRMAIWMYTARSRTCRRSFFAAACVAFSTPVTDRVEAGCNPPRTPGRGLIWGVRASPRGPRGVAPRFNYIGHRCTKRNSCGSSHVPRNMRRVCSQRTVNVQSTLQSTLKTWVF